MLKEQHQLYLRSSYRHGKVAARLTDLNHSLHADRCLLANRRIAVATNRMNEYANGGNSGITVEVVALVDCNETTRCLTSYHSDFGLGKSCGSHLKVPYLNRGRGEYDGY